MAIESFQSSTPDKNNEEEKSAEQIESSSEKGVGKNSDQYEDADSIGKNTERLKDRLSDEAKEKIQEMKKKKASAEGDSEDQAKAA